MIYTTETLKIQQVSPHAYIHTSYLQTSSFGKVDCNGMIVIVNKEAIIFDTPADEKSSNELIEFLNDWSETVTKVKSKYAQTRIVIPGHGKAGGTELLDYTISLFK